MARTKRNEINQSQRAVWRAALYTRLSREDGDKAESDSIANQRNLLERYAAIQPDLQIIDTYTDDGYTGTNFNRPDFKRMIADVETGRINCVLVKDLSRFGRDYIEVGRYLERYFPEHGVRFLAVNDEIDSAYKPYDMMLPLKNVFNENYSRDIAKKVRTSIQAKQRNGDFIGAFASYGYQKDPSNHNKLIIDPVAATVVQRIFNLFESGVGKIKIAKLLNEENIPCPSVYKQLNGDKYHNGQRLGSTSYWTYSTIHRILQNRMYVGDMEQGRAPRQTMHGKAKALDKALWTVVTDTHEPIIHRDQWNRVQTLLQHTTKNLDFNQNTSPFAGFLRCGDCGRAMTKTKSAGGVYYSCGSYKRYGASVCTKHSISHVLLEQILLDDLNKIIAAVDDLKQLADEARPKHETRDATKELNRLKGAADRIYRLKKSAYEDYRDGLLTKEEYLRYKEDYLQQEFQIEAQIKQLDEVEESILDKPWVTALLEHGKLDHLDRATVAETIKQILIFEDGKIEITYNFSDDLGILNT